MSGICYIGKFTNALSEWQCYLRQWINRVFIENQEIRVDSLSLRNLTDL